MAEVHCMSGLFERKQLIADIKECISCRDIQRGRRIQQAAIENGLGCNVYVASALIDMNAKFGFMDDARQVFDNTKDPNVVCWNALILGYAMNGEEHLALHLFSSMRFEGCAPNSRTYVAALKACAALAGKGNRSACKTRGNKLHVLALRDGCDSDVYVQSTLVQMYSKCGSIDDARDVFNNCEHSSVLGWNSSIFGYAENGQGEMALELFLRMGREGCEPDGKTFLAVFKACSELSVRDDGNRKLLSVMHALSMLAWRTGLETEAYLKNSLVGVYAKCASMEDAQAVFDSMEDPDVVSWTALILGYANVGEGEVALDLFLQLGRDGSCVPNERTFVAALKACTDFATREGEGVKAASRRKGKQLHLLAQRHGYDSDIYVQSTLVDMYAKCSSMINAAAVFQSIQQPDLVVWTALMLGYEENGQAEICLALFKQLRQENVKPDARVLVAALKASADLASKDTNKVVSRRRAKELHLLASETGCDSDIYVQGTLVDVYSKAADMVAAVEVFERIKHPNVVCWNALVLGCVDNGDSDAALKLFLRMISTGCTPDKRTYIAALKACTGIAAKEEGTIKGAPRENGNAVLLLACRSGCDSDNYFQNTLLDFYAKCGSMVDAQRVFESLKHPSVVSWTALILGYADNKEAETALELFASMKREGCVPNPHTFVAALKACGMLGALEIGRSFHTEICAHALEQDPVLRNSLVDFYVKCGSLGEAKQVFDLQGKRDLVAWNALMVGFGRNGDTKSVFDLFEALVDSGLHPDLITLNCVLNVCSHAGLVDRGKACFEAMSSKYGLQPGVEHYNCIIDMLGRANKLDEAMALVRSMPCPIFVTWKTILGACKIWQKTQLGSLAFQALISLEDDKSGAYVLMANIYGSE